ncbi:E-selectin [Elysia marginata]|uniref:E-selectin n=1 Tax=Elysia marginata TaxID=1093978 RepID=A0AAV4HZY6_9GAST|nr:E-selectin [Elysia marginata]
MCATVNAVAVCPKGRLARIESKKENDYIKRFLSKSEDFIQNVWIGGYEYSTGWIWQDTDKPITGFTDWAPQAGNNDDDDDNDDDGGDDNGNDDDRDDDDDDDDDAESCLAMSRVDNWAWRDYDCTSQYQILCEEL